MILTEEQKLIKSLSVIKHVLLVDLGVEDIKSEEEFEDGSKEMFSCIDVIEKHIVDYINSSQPYKFEDLKEGMWVWDNKDKKCLKIISIIDDGEYLNQSTLLIVSESGEYYSWEENRFYPVVEKEFAPNSNII